MDFLLKLVIGMAVLATIAAVNEGDGDLVKMFAKERKEMREEQKEMRADFRRENDEQNRVIAELHQGLAEQKKENAVQKKENADQKKQNEVQNRVIAEQKKQNDEQNRVIAEQKEKMKRLHKRLHRADLQNKEAHRQRDEKQSQERHSSELEDVVESVVKRSIRHSGKNNTNSSLEIELKKLIDHQIVQYLINQRICVAGKYSTMQRHTQTVNFGYEFPRTPTVSASLARVYNYKGAYLSMSVDVSSVTTTTAIIKSYAGFGSSALLNVSWLACL